MAARSNSLLVDTKNMSTKPRPLSSQPKRNWGDQDEKEDFLDSNDWPPSPKKQSTTQARTKNSTTSTSTATMNRDRESSNPLTGGSNRVGGNSWSNNNTTKNNTSASTKYNTNTTSTTTGTSKLPSFRAASVGPTTTANNSNASTKPKQIPFAPIFCKASQLKSTTGSYSSSTSHDSTKKRVMPWEDVAPSSKSASFRPGGSGSSSNFHQVGGVGGLSKGIKEKMLTSTSMDIKQKVILSPEQQMVLKLVVDEGKSVFFTGSAGTGKSVLLREIISSLKKKFKNSDAVAVTASTGMAACNIGGTTIHSFSGIGLGIEAPDVLIMKVRRNRTAAGKWSRCKVLVIDEVSMVDGYLFDKLAAIACALNKGKPGFGGIQLVVTGDFFQLPPVTKGTANFAFEAKAWSDCIQHTVNLTQVFRQKDTEFIDMLNEMRFGCLSQASISKFRALSREPSYNDGIDPTELFPMRTEVEKSNQARLKALPGEEVHYVAEDWAGAPSMNGKPNAILSNFMAPEKLVLKIGAQVMLIKNMDATLVNGTVGKVVAFGSAPSADEDDEDAVKEEGGPRKKVKVVGELVPVIEWRTPGGIERKAMEREEFKTEDQQGKMLARRRQYPIILAWAMSIHKSQGQTLPRVKVDLGKVFEKGQSYVALSRATCLEGLQVLRFDASKVSAHPKVVLWSKNLEVLS